MIFENEFRLGKPDCPCCGKNKNVNSNGFCERRLIMNNEVVTALGRRYRCTECAKIFSARAKERNVREKLKSNDGAKHILNFGQ